MELTLEESLSMFMAEITKKLDENTNLIKELRASMDFALRNQKASMKSLEIQVRQMSIILHEKLSRNLQSSTIIKPRGNDETISTSVKADKPSIRRIDASQYALLNETDGEENLEVHYTNVKPLGRALPRKEKDTGSFTLPCFINNMCFNKALADLGASNSEMTQRNYPLDPGRPSLSTAHAIINMFKAKITLSVRNNKVFFKSNKPTSNIIKRVYALSLIKSMELGLEARLMGNALRKNRLHDPKFEEYIELSDLNEPLELRHDQVVDLRPTIEEGEVIDAPIMEMVKTRHDKITNRIVDYPSFCNLDRKIHDNDAYNLRFRWSIYSSLLPFQLKTSYSFIHMLCVELLQGLKTSWEYRHKRPLIYHHGQEMDFRSFMIQGINGEFNFLPEGGFNDSQGSFFVKPMNNETPIIDAEPISVVLPTNVADNIVDSSNTSSDDELPPVHPATSSLPKASKVAGDASTPLDVDSDPDIHEFPYAKELKDAIDCHWVREVKRDKAYAELEKKCNEALQDLDKNPLVSDMRSEIETLEGQEIDSLRQDRAVIVSKVVPNATMKLVHSDDMGVLVAKLVRATIIHGRCMAFEEVAKLRDLIVLEKMSGYRTSSKDKYDRAGKDMVNVFYPFLSEFTSNPYAFVEQLLSIKPRSL
ncbi:hypothetical protein Tco_1516959 [Tanacetum coccineum]